MNELTGHSESTPKDELVEHIDRSLCTLVSMGQILTELMVSDSKPAPTWLADLGRVITKEADTTIELLQEYGEGNSVVH